jgi:hypothetical protein
MTDIEITERNLVDELRLTLPEIEDRYQKEIKSWGDKFPGNYNIFAFVLKPLLRVEFEKSESDDFFRRLCLFIERVCGSEDREAINVIWLKIFKLILPNPKVINLLWPHMGVATKRNIEDAAFRWGFTRNLPFKGQLATFKLLFTPHRRDSL